MVLTLARLGGRGSSSIVISTASPQVYLCRLRVCVGDVQQDEFASVFPVRSVPKTSSPDDDVHPQVPVSSERFAALHLEFIFCLTTMGSGSLFTDCFHDDSVLQLAS